jgi:hypothetical protein
MCNHWILSSETGAPGNNRSNRSCKFGQLLDLMDTSTRRIAELRLEQQGWPEIARLMGYKSGDAARKFFEAGLARLRKRLTGGPKETPEQD